MAVYKISEHRRAGRLAEAYRTAKQLLDSTLGDPSEIRNIKRNMGWVLYDYLKMAVEAKDLDKCVKVVRKIMDTNLDASENMLFEQYAWKIGKIIFHSAHLIEQLERDPVSSLTSQEESQKIKAVLKLLFEFIKRTPTERPSKVHDFLLSAFLKAWKEDPQFMDFADWWDFPNLNSENFQQEETPEGKKIPSLGERALIAYSKLLINAIEEGRSNETIERINRFLPYLESVTGNHPHLMFALFNKSKIYFALNQTDKALESFLPFARKYRQNFWVWGYLAELHDDDPDLQLSCYCRALLCETKDKFLSSIRLKLAAICLQKKKLREAKHEIAKYVQTRNKYGWQVSKQASDWQRSSWYAETEANSSNKLFYQDQIKNINSLLYKDIPETILVVTHVNTEKYMLNFMAGRKIKGFLNYKNTLESPKVGDIVKARIRSKADGEYYEILSASPEPESGPNALDFVKDVRGVARIADGKNFGFIHSKTIVFIPPPLFEGSGLKNGGSVSARAVASYDKRKKKWGWSAITIDVNE